MKPTRSCVVGIGDFSFLLFGVAGNKQILQLSCKTYQIRLWSRRFLGLFLRGDYFLVMITSARFEHAVNHCELSVLFGWKSNDFHSLTEVLKGLFGNDCTTIPPRLGNSYSMEKFSPRTGRHHSITASCYVVLLILGGKGLPWWAVLWQVLKLFPCLVLIGRTL